MNDLTAGLRAPAFWAGLTAGFAGSAILYKIFGPQGADGDEDEDSDDSAGKYVLGLNFPLSSSRTIFFFLRGEYLPIVQQ